MSAAAIDMDDFILHGGKRFDDYELTEDDHARIKPADQFFDEVDAFFDGRGGHAGIAPPWKKLHTRFAFRPGELTLWAGINGHGKSHMITQIALWLMAHGQPVLMSSLEVKPYRTLAYMTRQAWREERPGKDKLRNLAQWMAGKLWLYDQIGTIKAKRMVGVSSYAIAELGCRHVFIDSLLKCGMGEDDYNGQKSFTDRLATLAHDTGAHIHLVAHARKAGDEGHRPGKFDIRGSGAVSDLADNVLSVWRNKAKEEERHKQEAGAD